MWWPRQPAVWAPAERRDHRGPRGFLFTFLISSFFPPFAAACGTVQESPAEGDEGGQSSHCDCTQSQPAARTDRHNRTRDAHTPLSPAPGRRVLGTSRPGSQPGRCGSDTAVKMGMLSPHGGRRRESYCPYPSSCHQCCSWEPGYCHQGPRRATALCSARIPA